MIFKDPWFQVWSPFYLKRDGHCCKLLGIHLTGEPRAQVKDLGLEGGSPAVTQGNQRLGGGSVGDRLTHPVLIYQKELGVGSDTPECTQRSP